jgi:hypothetical protein
VHIVSSLDEVPAAERANVERVDLNSAEAVSRYPAATPGFSLPSIDWSSFALGFGAALLVAMVFRLLPGGGRWLWKLALVAGIALVLTGAYLGAVRRAAGVDGAVLAAPSALIQDAKTAVEQMNQRQKQQEEELRKLQSEGR